MIEKDYIDASSGKNFRYHVFDKCIVDDGLVILLTNSFHAVDLSGQSIKLFIVLTLNSYAELSDIANNAETHIQNNNLLRYGIDSSVPKTFAELQADKSKEISNACRMAIVSGFTSMALGEEYRYPSKTIDQQNLAASVLASYDPSNDSNWLTPFWCMDGSGLWEFRPHTSEQIREVGRDAKSAILGYQFHNEQLQAQISSATTVEELDAIVW